MFSHKCKNLISSWSLYSLFPGIYPDALTVLDIDFFTRDILIPASEELAKVTRTFDCQSPVLS